MGASIEAISLVACLDQMGVLALHDGQTLADLAMAIDAIRQGEPANGEPERSESEMQQRMMAEYQEKAAIEKHQGPDWVTGLDDDA